MDIHLKPGLLDVCVLSAIKDGDSYGYKIIKDMKPYMELSESTLYTILKRLEGAEMLTVYSVEHGGRLRKYYHITPQGLARIEEFKEDWREILSIYRFVTKEESVLRKLHEELARVYFDEFQSFAAPGRNSSSLMSGSFNVSNRFSTL